MSIIKKCVDDLVDAIRALPTMVAETINVGWAPDVDRSKLTSRQVYVDPEMRSTKMISRGCKQTEVSIIVAMISPHTQGQEDAIAEAEQVLVDAIHDGILGIRIGTRARALVESIEQPVLIDGEHWRGYRQATTMLRVRMVV